MRTLSSVTLSACSPLCLALLLTACGGKTDGASNAAGSAGTDATGGSAGTATAGSGGSGTAGTGGSGVAGTGGGGTAGSAGSAGGGAAGSAGSAGGDVQVPVVTGTPGEQCSPSGQLACGGVDSKVQLICSGGQWDTVSVCSGTTICDPRENSATLGTCVDKDPLCPTPGALSCAGNQLMQCDQTQLGMAVKETCQACYVDRCVGDPCPDPVPAEFVDMTGECLAECGLGNTSRLCVSGTDGCSVDVSYDDLNAVPLFPQSTVLRLVTPPQGHCASSALWLDVAIARDAGTVWPLKVVLRLDDAAPPAFVGETRCVELTMVALGSVYGHVSVGLQSLASSSVPVNLWVDLSGEGSCP